jgi:hypothetical protein
VRASPGMKAASWIIDLSALRKSRSAWGKDLVLTIRRNEANVSSKQEEGRLFLGASERGVDLFFGTEVISLLEDTFEDG